MVLGQSMMKNNVIYESPDGGKTVYVRELGSTVRNLFSIDSEWKKEQELSERWMRLKQIVFMADTDATLNDALTRLEILYALKKKES